MGIVSPVPIEKVEEISSRQSYSNLEIIYTNTDNTM